MICEHFVILRVYVLQNISKEINDGKIEPWLMIFSGGSENDESSLELKKTSALVPDVKVCAFHRDSVTPFLKSSSMLNLK